MSNLDNLKWKWLGTSSALPTTFKYRKWNHAFGHDESHRTRTFLRLSFRCTGPSFLIRCTNRIRAGHHLTCLFTLLSCPTHTNHLLFLPIALETATSAVEIIFASLPIQDTVGATKLSVAFTVATKWDNLLAYVAPALSLEPILTFRSQTNLSWMRDRSFSTRKWRVLVSWPFVSSSPSSIRITPTWISASCS